MESESVWRALASPHRRKLLDLLREGKRTTGELARELPDLSRFAVMQHLTVLEESRLIVVERDGRRRFNHLNPIPIRELYERWMRSHSSIAAETALHLKRYAESTHEVAQKMDPNNYRHITIEMEMVIAAPRERVFSAMTEELGNWWPHRYKPDSEVYCEPRVGGRSGERFRNGGGAIYGEIVYFDPGSTVISSGASSLNKGVQGYVKEKLEDVEGGTLYKRTAELWGTVPEQVEQMFREGTRALFEKALKDYLEKGVRYQIPEVGN